MRHDTNPPSGVLAAGWDLEVAPLRWVGGAMVGLGVVLPHLPHNPGLPCPLRTLTGVPCPLCGMTTAVKAACTGHVGSSVTANPFGIVAVVFALVLLVRPGVRAVRIPVALAVGVVLSSWIWELRRFGLI